jgi:uncharacterized membrane protein
MLVQYNQAFPGCAERIVAMAERQAAHRQDIEKTAITSKQEAGTHRAGVRPGDRALGYR